MTVIANHPSIITVQWRGLDADGRGALDISELPNRLTRAALGAARGCLAGGCGASAAEFKHFVFLF